MAFQTNRSTLDRKEYREVVLVLDSFVAGENKIGKDHELKANEARIIQNWDATSLGGMIRSKGFNEVGDGGVTYTEDLDFLIQHYEGTNNEVYGVIEGDLVILSGSSINQEDAAAFTSGIECHGVSFADTLWITNSSDGLRYKTIGNAIATPTQEPIGAGNLVDKSRIYYHNQRLIAEGGDDQVLGSRAGSGNWKATADTWTATNDAWSSDFQSDTRGCVPGFPSGGEVSVFTDFDVTVLSNFPNVIQRKLVNSHGCAAPLSIARGNEGIYFVSQFPTLGVYLWDSVNFINLTENHDFIEDVNLTKRIYGVYRNSKYHLFYNETGSGVTYPNKWRIFNARFGRWMERPVSTDLSDNFGYPALLTRSSNELYVGSSQKDKIYELETSDNSDETNNTVALYRTKRFTSIDWRLASGGALGIDDVRIKLTKMTVEYEGTTGTIGILWNADKGKRTGSISFDIEADGDRLNIDFTVNSSVLNIGNIEETLTRSVDNSAVGRDFAFDITNDATGTRPQIKKIKIHGLALDEA